MRVVLYTINKDSYWSNALIEIMEHMGIVYTVRDISLIQMNDKVVSNDPAIYMERADGSSYCMGTVGNIDFQLIKFVQDSRNG